MPEWSVHRRFPRYKVHIPLEYNVTTPRSNKAHVGWTFDLSERGACVELWQRLRPQTPLRICLQTDRGAIELMAKVVWAGKPDFPGGIFHGVTFTRIAPDHLQALRDLLRSAGPAQDTGLRLRLDLPVVCHTKGQATPALHGRTGDISRDGLLLLLPEVLPPNTAVDVTLHTPRQLLTMQGEIVWVEPPEIWTPGELIPHGFRFTSLGWVTPLVLALLLGKPPEGPQGSPSLSGSASPQ